MRVHVLLACAVVVAVVWVDLPAAQQAMVVIAIAGVLAAELFNTAVETAVDLYAGNDRHLLAGRAKDLSAAAVLVTAASAAVVGFLVLVPPAAEAVGAGRLDAATAGRAGVLLAILALAGLAMREVGRPRYQSRPRGAGRR
jgi:diacylglycerol kinase